MGFASRCLVVVALWATHALAQDAGAPAEPPLPPPPAEEIKRVLEYQELGKDRGPALLDVMPCLKIDQTKGSPTYFNCLEPITGPVKKDTMVIVWSQWFCPKGGKYDDLSIQWLYEGQVRSTVDVSIEGLARVRNWRQYRLGKVGKWQVKILKGGSKELGSTSIVVEN